MPTRRGARARARAKPVELFATPNRPDVQVSDEQWAVVELVRTRPLVLLTGLPGAGKTHTQRVLVETARRRAQARAALRADRQGGAAHARPHGHDAMTIHRALGYSPAEGGFQRDESSPLSDDFDLVIVDEASMLSLELADALFRAAGDCHVLLVGDTDQLPPIGAGSVLADLVECDVVPRVHLTAIYRQAARSLIIQSARRDQRRRSAVPLASTRRARRSGRTPCSTRTSSSSRGTGRSRCAKRSSSSCANGYLRGSDSTRART